MAVFLGFLGVLAFSFTLPATRVAVEQLDPTFVGIGREAFAALLAGLILLLARAPFPSRAQLRRLAIVAFGVVFGWPLFTAIALQDVTSAHSAVIVGILPAATAVAAVLRAGERPTRGFWLASLAGLIAVLGFAASQGAGLPSTADLLILIAVALSAIGYAEGGALARELGGWRVICWAVLLSAPLTIPIALVAAAGSDVHADADAWLGFAYVAGVSALLGFFPWYAGLARGGVAKIGQVQLVQPLLTLAWSAALLGRAREPNYAICGSPCRPLRRRHAADAGRSGSTGNVATVSDVAALNHLSSGKVRDIYAVGEDRLLLVASDRISTYDVVHPTPIPDKGKLLTGLTAFWLERTGEVCPNHLISFTEVPEEFRGRAMLVERLEMVPVECVVRGYITGSGWKDYQSTGAVCGIELPDGLRESEQLPEPIFTPATKAEVGDHDENVDFDRAAEIVGDRELLEELRRLSIAIYELGAAHARERGIILADTKFEFGRRPDGTIVLGDEVMTPDSSRFWPADGYEPGRGQPSFDKQYVRDWAAGSGWDKTPPAPALPDDVIERTRALYVDAYERITGEPFTAWLERSA